MKQEFRKAACIIDERSFDGGKLPFLIRVSGDVSDLSPEVRLEKQLGPIWTARASYEGIKELERHPNVVSYDISRPVGRMA